MTKNTKRIWAGLMLTVASGLGMNVAAYAQGAFHCVPAHATDRLYVWASAGRHAISIRGDGDTDLDFFVYDPRGSLVHVDTDSTDYTFGTWTQDQAGSVRVDIRNLGAISNCYVISVR